MITFVYLKDHSGCHMENGLEIDKSGYEVPSEEVKETVQTRDPLVNCPCHFLLFYQLCLVAMDLY